MAERLAYDICKDLRRAIGMDDLLIDAADKIEGLIELLARAEQERDQARAEVERLAILVDTVTIGRTLPITRGRTEPGGMYHRAADGCGDHV